MSREKAHVTSAHYNNGLRFQRFFWGEKPKKLGRISCDKMKAKCSVFFHESIWCRCTCTKPFAAVAGALVYCILFMKAIWKWNTTSWEFIFNCFQYRVTNWYRFTAILRGCLRYFSQISFGQNSPNLIFVSWYLTFLALNELLDLVSLLYENM